MNKPRIFPKSLNSEVKFQNVLIIPPAFMPTGI